jgi:MFS family permease
MKNNTIRRETRGVFWGWYVVTGTFVILSLSYGSKYCFGVFVTPMFSEYQWPMSTISLAASINFFMYAIGGIFSGWLLDRMAPKWIMTIGSIVTAIGFLLISFVHTPLQLYLSYGVLCGLGASGIGVVVGSSSVGKWFVRKRGVAVGVASMGIGLGTMILSPLAGYIVKHYQWRHGFVFFGLVILIMGTFVAQSLMRKTRPEDYGLLPDGDGFWEDHPMGGNDALSAVPEISVLPVLKDLRFWVLVLCFGVAVMSEIMAFVHQINYAINHHIDKVVAASSIGVIGVSSIFGRFFFGWLSDHLGDAKYAASLGFLGMAVGMFMLSKVVSVKLLYMYALVFGFSYGSLAPMMPILIADRFGRHILGAAYGWLTFFVVGCGGAFGPVLGGMIFDRFGSYAFAWQLNLILLLAAALLMLTLRPGMQSLTRAASTENAGQLDG